VELPMLHFRINYFFKQNKMSNEPTHKPTTAGVLCGQFLYHSTSFA
jgi:hypothetical protein